MKSLTFTCDAQIINEVIREEPDPSERERILKILRKYISEEGLIGIQIDIDTGEATIIRLDP